MPEQMTTIFWLIALTDLPQHLKNIFLNSHHDDILSQPTSTSLYTTQRQVLISTGKEHFSLVSRIFCRDEETNKPKSAIYSEGKPSLHLRLVSFEVSLHGRKKQSALSRPTAWNLIDLYIAVKTTPLLLKLVANARRARQRKPTEISCLHRDSSLNWPPFLSGHPSHAKVQPAKAVPSFLSLMF